MPTSAAHTRDHGLGAPSDAQVARALVQLETMHRHAAAVGAAAAGDSALERLLNRIRALRAETVEQGCTEQDALAAAKAASLLDRDGLTLSEFDLRGPACEGVSVETGRRHVGPVDECVPAVGAFLGLPDLGKGALGTLRHVFFDLTAHVAAAQCLARISHTT